MLKMRRNATTNQLVETVLTSNSNNISQISTHAIARDKARQELDRVIASKMSKLIMIIAQLLKKK